MNNRSPQEIEGFSFYKLNRSVFWSDFVKEKKKVVEPYKKFLTRIDPSDAQLFTFEFESYPVDNLYVFQGVESIEQILNN